MAKGIKPVKRVTKKEIKEDKLVTTYFQTRKYWEEHSKVLWRVSIVVLALVVLLTFWLTSKKKAEYTASYELGVALLSSMQNNPAAVSDQLKTLAERYSGTSAGNEALLFAAQTKRMAGSIGDALQEYEQYIQKGKKDRYLYPAAWAGKAACLEDTGRYLEAAQAYLRAAEANPRLFAVPSYYLDAARCFELGDDFDQAKVQCELVISRYEESAFKQEADKELTRIEFKM